MRTIRLALASAVVLSLLPVAVVEGGENKPHNDNCTRATFHQKARKAFDGQHPLTRAEKRSVRRSVRCLRGKSETLARWHYGRYRRWHIWKRAVEAVTPYGPYAIPAYVVQCESGGSWSAFNPSGAAGIYQLMPFWNRPWPVTTRAHKLAHHRIAFRLWAGGSGASNWVCA